jgi:hypothetical protein
MGTGALSSVVKRPEREADYSPPSIAEVNNHISEFNLQNSTLILSWMKRVHIE